MATGMQRSTIGTLQHQLDDLVLDLLPRQGQWSDADYLWLTDHTNHLIEFTDGLVEVLPMPTQEHQLILAFLFDVFRAPLRPQGGRVLFAPLRLHIRPGKYREPDLLLVLDAHDPRCANRYWSGADLVLEIVSPDGAERDLIEKRGDYAEAGVLEYWIVDPRTGTITVLRLEGGTYVEHGSFNRGQTATSALLPGFAVDVAAVFNPS